MYLFPHLVFSLEILKLILRPGFINDHSARVSEASELHTFADAKFSPNFFLQITKLAKAATTDAATTSAFRPTRGATGTSTAGTSPTRPGALESLVSFR